MDQNNILTTTDLARLIYNRLKRYRFVILIAAIFFAFLLALYAKNTSVTYTSRATIFSLNSSNDPSTPASALSIILGTESGKGFSDETSINIIELAQSRTTREAVAAMKVPSMGNKIIAALLVEDINNNRGWMEPKVKPFKNTDKLITWGGKVLNSGITATINKNNSFVLTYTGRSEELVKVISYGIIDKISQFYIDLKSDKARRDYEFASRKVDSLKRVMGAKDHMLIAIDKRSLFTDPDKLEYRMPNENLLADKQMIRNQYAQAVVNQQSAAYKLQKDTPIIKVLDKPEPPFDKKSRSAIIYGIIGFIAAGLFVGTLLISGLLFRYIKLEVSKAIFGNPPKTTTTTTASAL